MKVSIIIPTLNHLDDLLKPCCEAIEKYIDLTDNEVIVVANGCTDGTREYVESLGAPFRLLWFDDPIGYGPANNAGVKAAKGEYILFLNNDAFVKGGVVNLLLAEFERNPKTGVVGQQKRHNMETDRDFVIFYCAMMKKTIFEKFGMFDEVFADGTCEDVDLCIKLENAGYKLTALPYLPVHHLGGTTVVEMSNLMIKLRRNSLILGKKWNSKWYQEQIKNDIIPENYKVSIVVSTYNHLDDCLKPCCESLIKYCDFTNKEIIIVANGCKDGTREYVESLGAPFKLVWFDEAIGATRAYNEGMKAATGDYILLINNDVEFLDQEKDTVIKMHLEQFIHDPDVGIVGPLKSFSDSIKREFIIFFCAMIKKEVIEKIGYLDEVFGTGSAEDTDFCFRAEKAGYKLAVAGQMTGNHPTEHKIVVGSVPIYHKAEMTVHDESLIQGWADTMEKNRQILRDKHGIETVVDSNKDKVLCVIPTKGRYFSTLPLAIESVIAQNIRPDKLVIFDDGDHLDLRSHPIYRYFFNTFVDIGMQWEVSFGHGEGQHFGHQKANTSDYGYVWRLDDDTIAMPDVLQKLLSHMKNDVGAVAGSVITPGGEAKAPEYALSLLDVNRLPNIQWAKGEGLVEVEHLYSSFLYRTNIVDYCMELSKVAHREETIFSHRLFQAGYKLLVDRSAVTYHYRNPEGGIRTQTDKSLWEHDEEIFRKELSKMGYKMIALSHGLGDHLCFANIVPELLNRCKKLVLFCVYGDVFEDFEDVITRPLGEAGSFGIKETGVYEWMTKYNWRRSMLKAYEQLYLN